MNDKLRNIYFLDFNDRASHMHLLSIFYKFERCKPQKVEGNFTFEYGYIESRVREFCINRGGWSVSFISMCTPWNIEYSK